MKDGIRSSTSYERMFQKYLKANLRYKKRQFRTEMLNRNENASIRIESQNKCPNSKITDLA